MKVVFAGTSEFAVPAFHALMDSDHELALTLTQPARPAGRGRRLRHTPLHDAAMECGIEPLMPKNLNDPSLLERLKGAGPDALIVVAYGRLIPPAMLELPRFGGINLHPSLLPRWRGAAPVERAMLAGDRETGVAVMRMVETLDSGEVYGLDTVAIKERETAGELSARLAGRGAALLLETLDALESGKADARAQQGEATYARRLEVGEARLDFTQPARLLARRVMAFNPRPVAWCEMDGERLRILRAMALDEPAGGAIGTVVTAGKSGLDIATGQGRLRVTELQRAGRKVQGADTLSRSGDWAGRRLG
ncbi:MAG: methionyl-tRNA formyltransferase [Gammaproteobacteria bacterium]|nr:methionyl-tRNA formyltransferase [Gammaproteobacteria bacterium]